MFTKKTISYGVKDGSRLIPAEGRIPATRLYLDMWMKTLLQPSRRFLLMSVTEGFCESGFPWKTSGKIFDTVRGR